ncbi:hypothetical protein ABVT39_004627 [Epinephelus coioides]
MNLCQTLGLIVLVWIQVGPLAAVVMRPNGRTELKVKNTAGFETTALTSVETRHEMLAAKTRLNL